MALSATTIIEIQSAATASNVNSGGFNPANANMATDLTCNTGTGNTNSPIVTSASYSFVSNDVGHLVYIRSGTNWTPGWYPIASVSAGAATLSAAIGQASQINATTAIFGLNAVAGVATTGTPTAGVWSIDYSQTTAAGFTATDLASVTGTTVPSTVTSVTNPFTKAMVGNLIHVNSGTSWTAGWYEIVSVSTITATLDRAVGTLATLTAGTYHTGGALSLGSADNAVFVLGGGSSTGSTLFFIKGNATYATAGSITTGSGNGAFPAIVEGYASYRGDRPLDSTRPVLNVAATSFSCGNIVNTNTVIFTGTGATVLVGGSLTITLGCKVVNTSTTSTRIGISATSAGQIIDSEITSYRGRAFSALSSTCQVDGSYIHSSVTGISSTSNAATVAFTLIESCITTAITYLVSSNLASIQNCILYGTEAQMGIGITLGTGSAGARVFNNVIYGFATGVSHADVNQAGYDNYNTYFNNTANVNAATNWQIGPNSISVNPAFTNVSQVTGTTGAFTAANNILVDTTQNFVSAGVVAGRDYVYIISGTGLTNSGMYVGITSITTTTNTNDTLRLDTAQGTSTVTDKVYTITVGHNFGVGTSMKAMGFPGVFPGGLTTGYLDIGAVQRQESGGGGGGSFTFSG